jgi:hypothetical protein
MKARESEAAVSSDPPGWPAPTRRDGARRTEHLGLLSLAIAVSLVGFAWHPLWIVAVVLMVLLWGFMASELRSGRGNGSVLTEVVTAVATEAKDLTDAASGRAPTDSDDGAQIDPTDAAATTGRDVHDQEPEPVTKPQTKDDDNSDEVEPTKKELYAEARDAGIEGRSTMSKEELKQALEE